MEKMAAIYFQSELNLICTVLHINFIYTFVCIFAVNRKFLYAIIYKHAFFYYSIITFVCPTLYLPVKEMDLFDCVSHVVCLPLFV